MRLEMKSTVREMLKKAESGDNKDALWPLLKERYDLGCELRRPYEQRWLINLSFIAGRQYVFYNSTADLLQHLVATKGKTRVVDNKILPKFQKQVSRMIRNNPRMSVIPASGDQEDIKAAKVGDKVMKWFWRQNQMRKKIRQLSGWIYSCGNGFLDDRWDPKRGPMRFDQQANTLVYMGDVDCGVWSPFEIGVPAVGLNDVDLQSMPWMVRAKYRDLDWIAHNYERGREVKSEDKPNAYIDPSTIFGARYGASATSTKDIPGACLIEMFAKPCGAFPKGVFLAGSNGVILNQQDYPFDFFAMEQFKDIEIPGIFWGMATTEAAIWLQKIQNRTVSDVVDYNQTMAKGKWLSPRQAQLEASPNDQHGQMLVYTPVMGIKPEAVIGRGLPNSYQMAFELVARGMMELYHQHEVTSGTNKSDIRSGEMVSLLLEQDDFGNIPTHAVFEESLEAVMSRVLKRIQKGYQEDRIVQIAGRSGEFEVFAFKGADLKGNTDVAVAKESSLPDSKVARQASIMNRYEKGLYGMPQDPQVQERILRLLDEVPDEIQDIFRETHLDRQNARMENSLMMSQPLITYLVNQYDNHAAHLEEHSIQRKQPEYQRMKFTNRKGFEAIEVTFMTHVMQHQKFYQQQMELQQAAMLAAKGGK